MNYSDAELKKSAHNLRGLLNDLKRRPEDAAKELGFDIEDLEDYLSGTKPISSEFIKAACDKWPINERDFFVIKDDCPSGLKIMRSSDSNKSSRIMERAGKPYYDYRDTVITSSTTYRPEWIEELCIVDDNDPNNKSVQWNNGHFMHQFTYFIGDVNYYYVDENGNGIWDDSQRVYLSGLSSSDPDIGANGFKPAVKHMCITFQLSYVKTPYRPFIAESKNKSHPSSSAIPLLILSVLTTKLNGP